MALTPHRGVPSLLWPIRSWAGSPRRPEGRLGSGPRQNASGSQAGRWLGKSFPLGSALCSAAGRKRPIPGLSMACRVLITTVRSLAEPGAWAESPAGAVGFRRVTHPPGSGNLSGPIGLGRGASSVGRGCTGLPAELLISQLPLPCSPIAEETGNQITSVWAASRVCLCPLVPVTRTALYHEPRPSPPWTCQGHPRHPHFPLPGTRAGAATAPTWP